MTIKQYVLDALGKFWTKLKSTYVTNCASTSNNLALAASQGKVLQDQITALNSSLNRTSLSSGTNLDALVTSSDFKSKYYRGAAINSMTGIPSDLSSNAYPFALDVIAINGYSKQILCMYGAKPSTYERQQVIVSGSVAWGSWAKVPTRAEVDELNSNMLGSGQTLVDTYVTQEGSLSIPNYTNYRGLFVMVTGDSNNGVSVFIPKGLYIYAIPLSLNSKNDALVNDGTGYVVSVQGNVQNGTININFLNISRWTKVKVLAFGVS